MSDEMPRVDVREEPDQMLYGSVAFSASLLRSLSSEDAKRVIYLELERLYHLLLEKL